MSDQLSWDITFLKIAHEVATHSTCAKSKVGAVIVKDRRVISMGMNGVPSGITPHCCDLFKPEDFTDEDKRIEHGYFQLDHEIHAEINAILFAARYGISTNGCTLYSTLSPCPACSNAIINSGIIRVIFYEKYRLTQGLQCLTDANIPWEEIGPGFKEEI